MCDHILTRGIYPLFACAHFLRNLTKGEPLPKSSARLTQKYYEKKARKREKTKEHRGRLVAKERGYLCRKLL